MGQFKNSTGGQIIISLRVCTVTVRQKDLVERHLKGKEREVTYVMNETPLGFGTTRWLIVS